MEIGHQNAKKIFLDSFLRSSGNIDEILIPYSSQYEAYDALTKMLKTIFPKSIPGSFCTALEKGFNKEKLLGLPKCVLYASNKPEFLGLNEHKFIDVYGPGLYTYSPINEKSIMRCLGVLGNGLERVSPYVHLLKIKNCSEVFKCYDPDKTSIIKFQDETHHFWEPSPKKRVPFNTDLYTFVFRPHIPPLSSDNVYPSFGQKNDESLQKCVKSVVDKTKEIEEKQIDIENGLFALNEGFVWEEELDSSDIKELKNVIVEEAHKLGFLATRTARTVMQYLDELIVLRRELKDSKEKLDDFLTARLLNDEEMDDKYHKQIMNLFLANRFGPFELGKGEETEFEQVVCFKFLPMADASHFVGTYGVTGAASEGELV